MRYFEKPHCHKNQYLDYYVNQAGGDMPAFVGARYQKGHGLGNILRTLTRFALPMIKKGVKVIGKQALKTGLDVAGDMMAGEPVKKAAKHRISQGLKNLINQQGKGGPPGQRLKKGYKRKTPSSKPISLPSAKRQRRLKDTLS